MARSALPPGSTIGILGGGQLGRMLAMAAAKLGLHCHVYCDEDNAPAFEVAARHTVGAYDDEAALDTFARAVDVATVEFENVPAATLAAIGKETAVFPPPRALEASQDRLAEKMFATGLGIAVAPHMAIDTLADLERAVSELGTPALLKTRRLGYDGKGQAKITGETDLAGTFASLDGAPALLEKFVKFQCEVSIIAVRGQDGDIRSYDPPENLHANQILSESRVPARIPDAVADEARVIVRKLADALDYCGVICVELFYTGEDENTPLILNEFAPRVHNSGHWTLDACPVSQFENHIRAVAGWPLGDCARECDAVMTNLIGPDVERWSQLAKEDGASIHLYGKRHARPGRKMGHVTRVSPLANGADKGK